MRYEERTAFTLVELLVVITIIGILVALLLPAVQAAREAARRMQCSNNLKQLGLALHLYHDAHRVLPPCGFTVADEKLFGWGVSVMPYFEQRALYDALDFSGNYYSEANKRVAMTPVPTFLCPSQGDMRSQHYRVSGGGAFEIYNGEETYTIHYQGVAGPKGTNPTTGKEYPWKEGGGAANGGFASGGVLYRDSSVSLGDVCDGTSNTYMLGELSWKDSGVFRIWSRGCDASGCAACKNVTNGLKQGAYATYLHGFNDCGFGSEHPGGANFCMADGSLQFVSESIHLGILKATASRNGGEMTQ